MAARSRRSSTMASTMATQDLARQRTEMHIDATTWQTAGKRKSSRCPKQDREPKPKKQRRPRRWAPPGWDGNRWSARSIQPGGLETHHEPCMSSFISPEPSSPESSRRMSWLRPRNSVSIWEHFAEAKRRADETLACGAVVACSGDAPVLASGIGMASIDQHNALVATGTLDRPVADADGAGCPPPRTIAAEKRPAWQGASTLVAAMTKSRSSAAVDVAGFHDVPAPQTPAVICPADRVSIMSLVSGP